MKKIKYFIKGEMMEPIAKQLKEYLGTIGFNKKKTSVEIKYDNKLVKGKLHTHAHIVINGPVEVE